MSLFPLNDLDRILLLNVTNINDLFSILMINTYYHDQIIGLELFHNWKDLYTEIKKTKQYASYGHNTQLFLFACQSGNPVYRYIPLKCKKIDKSLEINNIAFK